MAKNWYYDKTTKTGQINFSKAVPHRDNSKWVKTGLGVILTAVTMGTATIAFNSAPTKAFADDAEEQQINSPEIPADVLAAASNPTGAVDFTSTSLSAYLLWAANPTNYNVNSSVIQANLKSLGALIGSNPSLTSVNLSGVFASAINAGGSTAYNASMLFWYLNLFSITNPSFTDLDISNNNFTADLVNTSWIAGSVQNLTIKNLYVGGNSDSFINAAFYRDNNNSSGPFSEIFSESNGPAAEPSMPAPVVPVEQPDAPILTDAVKDANATQNATATITGYVNDTNTGSLYITIYVDGEAIGSTMTNTDGSFTVSVPLPAGDVTYTATASYTEDGVQSEMSNSISVIDATPTPAPETPSEAPSDADSEADSSASESEAPSDADSSASESEAPSDADSEADSSASESEAPSDADSSAGESEAPSDADSSASESEAPSDADSSASESEAPSDADSSASESEAPSDADSSAGESEAPSDADSSASESEAPSDADSSAGESEAPSDADSSASESDAPSDADSSASESEAPSDADSSASESEAPSDADSSASESEAPSDADSSASESEAPSDADSSADTASDENAATSEASENNQDAKAQLDSDAIANVINSADHAQVAIETTVGNNGQAVYRAVPVSEASNATQTSSDSAEPTITSSKDAASQIIRADLAHDTQIKEQSTGLVGTLFATLAATFAGIFASRRKNKK
ncbi:MAG: hypothetical protein LBT37_07290 [Lactobacillaceae bacterium]|jgi:hypothetical protein|nr:hypothetical protein [Lactobacillaceae bacterium]